MKPSVIVLLAAAALGGVRVTRIPGGTHPPTRSIDYGPAATEMVVFKDPRAAPRIAPQPEFAAAATGGPTAAAAYRNVQVLGGVSKAEFDRTMVAITAWVSPKQGCGFCHGGQTANYAADYPQKEIARRMLAMTRVMNANWTNHVGVRGVTCYSCHAGRNVPADLWHLDPPLIPPEGGLLGKPQAWNTEAKTIRTFFPNRPDRMFLLEGLPANHVQAHGRALATTAKAPFQHDRDYAEQVYVEMMQWSNGLGVNCTYCHQSRNLYDWAQSPPQRLHGYSGEKMTVMLNQNFFAPLTPLVRAAVPSQIGKMGDASKANCKTCHQGLELTPGGMTRAVYPALIGPAPTGVPNVVAATNPDIPQLSRAPLVGQPATDRLVEFKGRPQP